MSDPADRGPLSYATPIATSRNPRDGLERIASAVRFVAYAIAFLAGAIILAAGRNSEFGLIGILIMVLSGSAALVNLVTNTWG